MCAHRIAVFSFQWNISKYPTVFYIHTLCFHKAQCVPIIWSKYIYIYTHTLEIIYFFLSEFYGSLFHVVQLLIKFLYKKKKVTLPGDIIHYKVSFDKIIKLITWYIHLVSLTVCITTKLIIKKLIFFFIAFTWHKKIN